MNKFKFNLESLLVMREWEERRTHQALSETNAQVVQLQDRMKRLSSEKTKAFSGWDVAGATRFSAMDRLNLNSQVAEIENQTVEYRQQLGMALADRARAIEALSVATRRKRAVENLKEKRTQQHLADAYKEESAEIEDIFNARRRIS